MVGNEDKIRFGPPEVKVGDKVRFGHNGWGSYSDGTITHMKDGILIIKTEYGIVQNVKIEAVYQIL